LASSRGATVAIPAGKARLNRIIDLVQSCSYSVHDLSRVQMDRNPPATPRFKMPFELGAAVSWAKRKPESTPGLSSSQKTAAHGKNVWIPPITKASDKLPVRSPGFPL
jgi:hypothetical protein